MAVADAGERSVSIPWGYRRCRGRIDAEGPHTCTVGRTQIGQMKAMARYHIADMFSTLTRQRHRSLTHRDGEGGWPRRFGARLGQDLQLTLERSSFLREMALRASPPRKL
eukprot:scaffold5221_cov397-Prasinococcus_capsulatus_cf.AAC.3